MLEKNWRAALADYADIDAIMSAYFSTTTTKNDSVTLVSLCAIGGPLSDIVIEFTLDNDVLATFTPAWYVNSLSNPLTFNAQVVPALATIVNPAADAVYRYEFPGTLAEGLTLQFRLAQDNAGDATNAVEGALTWKD